MAMQQTDTSVDVDVMITRTVRALMGAHGMNMSDLSEVSGIPLYTISRRMRHPQWFAWEVATIADYFGRTPQDLFDGNVGNINRRARRDSNSQPSDPKVGRRTFPHLVLGGANVA